MEVETSRPFKHCVSYKPKQSAFVSLGYQYWVRNEALKETFLKRQLIKRRENIGGGGGAGDGVSKSNGSYWAQQTVVFRLVILS